MPPTKKAPPHPTADVPGLEQVVEDLTVEIQQLKGHIEVLRIAIDDLRCEVEWGVRQIAAGAWRPTQSPITPMQGDSANPAEEERVETEPVDAQPVAPPESFSSSGPQQRGLWD